MYCQYILIAAIIYSTGIATASYSTYYVEDSCIQNTNGVANYAFYGTSGGVTSIIIKATREPPHKASMNCTIFLSIYGAFTHGIVLSIRRIDFKSYSSLIGGSDAYIKIYESPESVGSYERDFRSDPDEWRTYTSEGDMSFLYHTDRGYDPSTTGFEVIATAYSIRPCLSYEYECDNGKCIWNGLKCDGHNNCGDRSDERIFICNDIDVDGLSSTVSVSIALGTIGCFSIIGMLLYYCFRKKRIIGTIVSTRPINSHVIAYPPPMMAPPVYSVSVHPAVSSSNPYPVNDVGILNPGYTPGK